MYLPNGSNSKKIARKIYSRQRNKNGISNTYTHHHLQMLELYKTSGHWDHYKEDMFPSNENGYRRISFKTNELPTSYVNL